VLTLSASDQPLHRLKEVRERQGVSRRTAARRLGTDVSQIKIEERETTDLLLSRLYEWQEALEVPMTELLAELDEGLSSPVRERAQMVRVMKTALALLEKARRPAIRRLAETLVEQLVEVMPELEGVGPWHSVGQRRRRDELGVAAQRRLIEDLFVDRSE
jgi:transcriptional regulator with XRE-family HTH domain